MVQILAGVPAGEGSKVRGSCIGSRSPWLAAAGTYRPGASGKRALQGAAPVAAGKTGPAGINALGKTDDLEELAHFGR